MNIFDIDWCLKNVNEYLKSQIIKKIHNYSIYKAHKMQLELKINIKQFFNKQQLTFQNVSIIKFNE